MADAVNILTPIGRLVQGHPMESNDVLDDNKQPKLNSDGSKQVSYYIALAFPKTDQAFLSTVWSQLQQVAQRDWPQGQYNAPSFAWKVIDGDGVDKEGKPYSSREGFAGHFVLKINSGFAYPVVGQDGVTPIVTKTAIKRGDYLRAYVSVKGNSPSKSPGLYINPQFAQLMGYGAEIKSGPDVAGILKAAGAAPALPAGASATPTPGQLSTGLPVSALPGVASVPGVPVSVAPPAMASAPASVFPPAGWLPHPQAPGHFYQGNVVKTEAELRMISAASVVPNPAILSPAVPGLPR